MLFYVSNLKNRIFRKTQKNATEVTFLKVISIQMSSYFTI